METRRNYKTTSIKAYKARKAAKIRKQRRADAICIASMVICAVTLIFRCITSFGSTEINCGPETAINISEEHQDVNWMPETETYAQDEAQKNALVVDYNISYGDEPTIEAAKSYTDEDFEYLVMLLTGECQTSSYDDQILYGSVALNRVASKDYPNTVKGVCLDTKYGVQYSSFKDGNAYRTPTETSKSVAKYLLENGSQLPADVIYQAEFKQGKVYAYTDGTYFCYR